MEDLVEILEGKISTDVRKHVPIKHGIKFCFMWRSTSRICRGTFFFTHVQYNVVKIGVTGKNRKVLINKVTFQYLLSGVSRRITKQQNDTTN